MSFLWSTYGILPVGFADLLAGLMEGVWRDTPSKLDDPAPEGGFY